MLLRCSAGSEGVIFAGVCVVIVLQFRSHQKRARQHRRSACAASRQAKLKRDFPPLFVRPPFVS